MPANFVYVVIDSQSEDTVTGVFSSFKRALDVAIDCAKTDDERNPTIETERRSSVVTSADGNRIVYVDRTLVR